MSLSTNGFDIEGGVLVLLTLPVNGTGAVFMFFLLSVNKLLDLPLGVTDLMGILGLGFGVLGFTALAPMFVCFISFSSGFPANCG